MGQISLPRLEKINTTMCWESSLLYNKERWLSIKSFIFLKLLIQYMFKNSHFRFKTKWIKSNKLINSQYIYKNLYFLYNNTDNINLFYNNYIYQKDNKYSIVTVFLS
jgi:hypothetical protein